jgi:DnaJ family protein A protein 2
MNDDDVDHYAVLGVQSDASIDDIRTAYKTLALKYHPDRNIGASESDQAEHTKKFQEISSAYEILSDTEKRVQYDLSRVRLAQYNNGVGGGVGGEDAAHAHPRGSHSSVNRDPRTPSLRFKKSPDLTITIAISLVDAYKGITKEIRFLRKVVIDPIGEKMHDMSCYAVCHRCGGRGSLQIFAIMSIPIERPCFNCQTHGCVLKQGYTITEIESCHELCCRGGIKDMDVVRLEHFGNWELGFFPGDVILRVRVFNNVTINATPGIHNLPHTLHSPTTFTYNRRDNDLYLQNYPILLSQALCGGDFRILTLDNRSLFVTFAGPIRNGEEKVIEGEGMPILAHGQQVGRGNLIIRFDVQFPTLSDAKKAAIMTILPIADQITKGGHEIAKILK